MCKFQCLNEENKLYFSIQNSNVFCPGTISANQIKQNRGRSYLSSGGTDIFHIFNAADTVLRNFPTSHPDVVPEATRTFITKPGYLTFRR